MKSGRTYGESNCYGRVWVVVFEVTTYLKKHGRRWLERCWCAQESPKAFQLIRCDCEKGRNYHI